MTTPISFFVPGEPKAQPRARSFVLRGRGGKPILTKDGQPIIRVHDPSTAEGWKSAIAQAAKEFVPMPPLQGPLRMDIEFRFARPKAHFRSNGELKPASPNWHIKKPDRDNLEKAVTDALKVIGMFSDDCQVCAGEISKLYSGKIVSRVDEIGRPAGSIQFNDAGPGAQITITQIEK